MDLIPSENDTFGGMKNKLVVDGANGVGGVKLKVLEKLLNGLVIEVRNFGEDGVVLNEGVGADYVQKEKVVPHDFVSKMLGKGSKEEKAILRLLAVSVDQPSCRRCFEWITLRGSHITAHGMVTR